MPDMHRHFDLGSRLVILITFLLFVAALFFKGFGHDLLLEAGVFLVSVKLIVMAYKSSVAAREMNERLDDLRAALTRAEGALGSRCLPERTEMHPSGAPQPPCEKKQKG
jgi:hypothetical protein